MCAGLISLPSPFLIFMYVCLYECMSVFMYVCIYVCTYVCIHIWIRRCLHFWFDEQWDDDG